MVVKCRCIGENENSYQGKKGFVSLQRLTLLDEDNACRFLNTFDYDMSSEEKSKHTGKITGKLISLGVSEMQFMNGRIKARGRILEIHA